VHFKNDPNTESIGVHFKNGPNIESIGVNFKNGPNVESIGVYFKNGPNIESIAVHFKNGPNIEPEPDSATLKREAACSFETLQHTSTTWRRNPKDHQIIH